MFALTLAQLLVQLIDQDQLIDALEDLIEDIKILFTLL